MSGQAGTYEVDGTVIDMAQVAAVGPLPSGMSQHWTRVHFGAGGHLDIDDPRLLHRDILRSRLAERGRR